MIDLSSLTMYRGARSGDPSVLTGPSYFSSSEAFAKTYGKTAAFRLNVTNPLVVSNEEWPDYANNMSNPIEDVIARVEELGNDSVVNVRKTPGGALYTVFLIDPSAAELVDEMKTNEVSLKRLRRLISEVLREEDTAVWGSHEELDRSISSMDANTIARKDYIDEETGEVYLSAGDAAGSSILHPQHQKEIERKRQDSSDEWDRERAEWAREDEEYELEKQRAFDEASSAYVEALSDYAGNWTHFTSEMPGVEPEDAAPDAADGFFHEYPEWRSWARALDLSKEDIRSAVVDHVHEAMLTGKA